MTDHRCWACRNLLAFDLETTGKDPLEARIVTGTAIRIAPGRKTQTTSWLSDVDGHPIPEEATGVHGITTEHARAYGRPAAEVVAEIADALCQAWTFRVPVVGHNVCYDLTVVAAECARLDVGPFDVRGPVVDSIVLDRGVDRYRKGSRKLTDTAAHYGVPLSEEDAHGAEADALAAARIAWKIAHRYPWLGAKSLIDLMDWQRDKHREWADHFGEYLAGKGEVDDVSRDWPIRTLPDGATA